MEGRHGTIKGVFRDRSLIMGRGGGATKWENRGSETFCAPPSRQGKTCYDPPPPHTFKDG